MKVWSLFLFLSLLGISLASEVNVALNKNASHAVTFDGNTADNAVDGCIDTRNITLGCCSVSVVAAADAATNFWQVDLGEVVLVHRVRIYARSQGANDNQLFGFLMYSLVGDTRTLIFNDTDNQQPTDGIIDIPLDTSVNASSVRVERPDNPVITLCEVQIYKVCDDGTYGTNCAEVCGKCAGLTACNKTDGTCEGSCEAGWTGDKCDARENVAEDKNATQSSNLYPATGLADKATDGCLSSDPPENCCSSTAAQAANQLTVDFGSQQYDVGRVKVYGYLQSETQLSGFTLHGMSRMGRSEELLYNNSGVVWDTGIFDIMIEPARLLQELTVKRSTGTPQSMTVCEIQAFEVCPAGQYGDVCELECGNCVSGEICHGISGRCVQGCAAGWGGDVCKTGCVSPSFGPDCQDTCNCLNNATCDTANGTCPGGCDVGWTGNSCSQECENNTYGYGCNETCGQCLNGSQCDTKDGTCANGCAPGYQGNMCNAECISPNFGADCAEKCNCQNNTTCNPVSGACPSGCDAGWSGSSCSQACQNQTYGQDCANDCGHCMNKTTCDVISGICADGCDPGWLGETCKTACSAGSYGTNCSSTCSGNCRDNVTCDVMDGSCAGGCAAGYQGDGCSQACANGTFGEDCIGACYCAGRVPCDTVTGVCPAGGCEEGFAGDYCHTDLSRSRSKPASLSSTLSMGGFLWNASLAVDGNIRQDDPATSRTCSATEPSDSTPWWSVNMESESVIDSVIVYGPTGVPDQLVGFKLYLTNQTVGSANDLNTMTPAYDSASVPYGDGIYNITLSPSRIARYLYIAKTANDQSLTLCEVRVFGECPDGRFGLDCGGMCHCASGVPCDKETGLCPGGDCAAGWRTDQCDEACNNGFFGDGCSSTCGSCFENDVCDHVTGACARGCAAGYRGDDCRLACVFGLFGQNCTGQCGNCKDNVTCNNVDGTCTDGCAPGFQGANCTQGCADGFYDDCVTTCGSCVNDTICDTVTGACALGCKDGFLTDRCVAAQVGGDADDDSNLATVLGGVFGALGFVLIVVYTLAAQVGGDADDDSNLAAVLGGVGGALGFVIIVVVAIKCYKARSTRGSKNEMHFTSPYASAMRESERGTINSASTIDADDYYGYYNVDTKM